ncbi:MAG: TonB-dependent receptor [Thermodesulfobacteriota bacterium]
MTKTLIFTHFLFISLALLFTAEPGYSRETWHTENFFETPFAVTLIDGDLIDRLGADDISDLSPWVAGLSVFDTGGREENLRLIRGFSHSAAFLGELPVIGIDPKLLDLERVEIVKGPQGVAHGSGIMSGVVHYIPRKPDTDKFSLSVRAGGDVRSKSGGYGYEADAIVNLPVLKNRLAFRGAVRRSGEPGFIDYNYLLREPGVSLPDPRDFGESARADNLRRKKDADDEKALYSRLSLLWRLTEDIEAAVSYDRQKQESGARRANHTISDFNTGKYESAFRYLEPGDSENEIWSANLKWKKGPVLFTGVAGHSKFSYEGWRDQTDFLLLWLGIGGLLPHGTVAPYADENDADYSPYLENGQPDLSVCSNPATAAAFCFREFSALTVDNFEIENTRFELRAESDNIGKWRFAAGLFYEENDDTDAQKEFTPGLVDFFNLADFDAADKTLEYETEERNRNTEKAVFGEVSRSLFDRWLKISAGGRWYSYEGTVEGFTRFPFTPGENGGAGEHDSPYSKFGSEDSGAVYSVKMEMTMRENFFAYFTRAGGYRLGGRNRLPVCSQHLGAGEGETVQASCLQPNEVSFKPDSVANYEIGFRGSWLGGAVEADAAVFSAQWKDIQTIAASTGSGEAITVNEGGAETAGLEFSLVLKPFEEAEIRGSWSYLNTEDGHNEVIPYAPEHTASLLALYKTALAGAPVDFLYGYSRTSKFFRGHGNSRDKFGGYGVHNLSASVSVGRMKLSAFAENLLNKYSATSAVNGVPILNDPLFSIRDGFSIRIYARTVTEPRRIGLRLKYLF